MTQGPVLRAARLLRCLSPATSVVVLATSLAALGGCKRSASQAKPLPSGDPGPVASGVPISPAVIAKVVNPKGEQPYSGPTVTVRGTVHITGDPPPDEPEIVNQIPEGCPAARDVYGKMFREGPGRTVADVLVAVIGYEGYVPARAPSFALEAAGCAWSTRTVGLTLGQRIDVVVKDRRAYVPELLGSRLPIQLIALPGTDGALYPETPGRYLLVDSMRIFARAEVLVVKYATFDVTKLDGKFTIPGVPIGKVVLNAFLPSTFGTVNREIVLEEGKDPNVDLELRFNEKEFRARVQADLQAMEARKAARKAGSSAATSAPPAPSGSAPAP